MRIENIEVKLNKHCLYVLIFLKLLGLACQNGGSNPIPVPSLVCEKLQKTFIGFWWMTVVVFSVPFKYLSV